MDEQRNIDRLSRLLIARSPTQAIFESLLIVFIEVLAFVGNILVCYVFYKKPLLHTVTNVYVGALAISDVLMSVLVMPWTVGILVQGEWSYGNTVCQFQGFVVLFLAWTSLHIMTLTAINRYFCVVKSTTYKKWFSIKSSIVMVTVAMVTIIVFILIPIVSGWSHFTFRPGKGTCFMTFYQNFRTIRRAYIAIVVFFYSVLPMFIIFSCYYKVFKAVRNHVAAIQPSFQNRSSRNTLIGVPVREVRVTRTLFCMVIGFVVCWIPVITVEMMNSYQGTASLPRSAYLCYMVFAYISGAINPIIYAVINKVFRSQLLSVLRPRKRVVIAASMTVRTCHLTH